MRRRCGEAASGHHAAAQRKLGAFAEPPSPPGIRSACCCSITLCAVLCYSKCLQQVQAFALITCMNTLCMEKGGVTCHAACVAGYERRMTHSGLHQLFVHTMSGSGPCAPQHFRRPGSQCPIQLLWQMRLAPLGSKACE